MTDNEKRFIQGIFSGDSSGHDYYHTIRVYKLATKIAKQENADVKIVQFPARISGEKKRAAVSCGDSSVGSAG